MSSRRPCARLNASMRAAWVSANRERAAVGSLPGSWPSAADGAVEALLFVSQRVGQAQQAHELGLGVDQLPKDLVGLGAAIRDKPKRPAPPSAADEVAVGA